MDKKEQTEKTEKPEKKLPSKKEAEEIVAGFNALRADQRKLTQKVTELEADKNEHNLVINTLKEIDPSRRCFRMIGGILVERNVGQVLPALENNVQQIEKVIETLNQQAVQKGQELVEYRGKYNIQLSGQPSRGDAHHDDESAAGGDGKPQGETTGVLVDSAK